jgi:hypothetical protein
MQGAGNVIQGACVSDDCSAAQELATQAKACVKRALEAEASLHRGALQATSGEIEGARERVRGLLTQLKAAEDDIAACVNPKVVCSRSSRAHPCMPYVFLQGSAP